MQAMAIFVPLSEFHKDNKALHERIDDVKKRPDAMDKRVWGAVAGAVTAFGSVLTKVGLLQ